MGKHRRHHHDHDHEPFSLVDTLFGLLVAVTFPVSMPLLWWWRTRDVRRLRSELAGLAARRGWTIWQSDKDWSVRIEGVVDDVEIDAWLTAPRARVVKPLQTAGKITLRARDVVHYGVRVYSTRSLVAKRPPEGPLVPDFSVETAQPDPMLDLLMLESREALLACEAVAPGLHLEMEGPHEHRPYGLLWVECPHQGLPSVAWYERTIETGVALARQLATSAAALREVQSPAAGDPER